LIVVNGIGAAAAENPADVMPLLLLLLLLLFLLLMSGAVLLLRLKLPCTWSTLHPPKGRLLQEQGHWVPLQQAALQPALQLQSRALEQQQLVRSGGERAG
jgi:hypothetical protein